MNKLPDDYLCRRDDLAEDLLPVIYTNSRGGLDMQLIVDQAFDLATLFVEEIHRGPKMSGDGEETSEKCDGESSEEENSPKYYLAPFYCQDCRASYNHHVLKGHRRTSINVTCPFCDNVIQEMHGRNNDA